MHRWCSANVFLMTQLSSVSYFSAGGVEVLEELFNPHSATSAPATAPAVPGLLWKMGDRGCFWENKGSGR